MKSENYELDSDGCWKKIKRKNTGRFKDTKDRHQQSVSLGKIGELTTAAKFIEHGYKVYVPLIDDGVDMVVEKNNDFKKVQVKSASPKSDGNSTMFSLKTTELNVKDNKIELLHNIILNMDSDWIVNDINPVNYSEKTINSELKKYFSNFIKDGWEKYLVFVKYNFKFGYMLEIHIGIVPNSFILINFKKK